MAKVFVFDLDDTLYKEIDFLKSAYQEIAVELQKVGVCHAYLKMLAWYEAKQNVFEKLNEFYHVHIPIEYMLQLYRNHFPTISFSEGAEVLLASIVDTGDKVGIITDGRSITQNHKIQALGLQKYVHPSDIVISEDFGSQKPDARNYRYFESQYPSATKFVYIADNPLKDFITPNQLGWLTIGLKDNGRNIHAQEVQVPEDYLPQVWVKSLDEIKDLLSQL
jgi:putative hydrolase of the HAD superfamily